MSRSLFTIFGFSLAVIVPLGAFGQDIILTTETVYEDQFQWDEVLQRLEELDPQLPGQNGDVDANGHINVTDAVYLLNFVFRGGPEPAPLSCSLSERAPANEIQPLRGISLHLAVNETDGDAEIRISASPEKPIRDLTLHDPSGRRILVLQAHEGQEIGLDEVILESSDPALEGVKKAYPEGAYLFQAVTMDGDHVAGLAGLAHDLLPAPRPQCTVKPEKVVVQWIPVEGASGYILEIEQAEIGLEVTLELEPGVSTYALPSSFLAAGAECELSLAAVTEDGNISAAETTFTIPANSRPTTDY